MKPGSDKALSRFQPLLDGMAALLPQWFRSLSKILLQSITSWIHHRAASKGAALAFYTLISLTPILILSIAVAGYFFGAQAAQGQIIAQIRYLVGPNGAVAIQSLLAAANDHVRGLWATMIASALLLVGATSVFAELKGSLDELWGVEKSQLSPVGMVLKTRLLAFGLVLVLTFLLLISLVISTALSVFSHYVGGVWTGSYILFFVLSELISFSVIASLFAVIYKMLPDAPLSWHDVWIGAAFTAGLFTLGKYLIGMYLGNKGVASGFGAAGSVTALLLWVYYSAQIFFLGAEFTRQYALYHGSLKHLTLHGKKAHPLAADMALTRALPEG
ncbi:MAG TPA: YihY/virulence factor BrkB family protein [Methylophilaceae bacterium]